MFGLKKILRASTPPGVLDLLYRSGILSHTVKWEGDFSNWEEALAECSSYNSDIIFEKVRSASHSVEKGEAAFERDSVLFDEIEYSWPLLSSLLWVYAKTQHLDLIDYGGALGTTWRQNKPFLSHLNNISWTIVEQEKFVDLGNKEFTTSPLLFKKTLKDAYLEKSNSLLLGSTLGYIENPNDLLDEILGLDIEHLILDRTLVQLTNNNILSVQTVKPRIYSASYPCWILSEEKLLQKIEGKYERIDVWRTDDDMIRNAHFIGGLWVRRTI